MNQELLSEALRASKAKTIKELFSEDPGRAGRYTLSAAGWTLDYSKNRIDSATMKALIKIAETADLKSEIERMFTGEKINRTENRAVLHTALRNCDPAAKVFVDGRDVMPDVRETLAKMGEFAEKVRSFGLTEIMERVNLDDSFEYMKLNRYAKERPGRYSLYYIVR